MISSRIIACNLFVVTGIPYLTLELLRHPLWAIPFFHLGSGFPTYLLPFPFAAPKMNGTEPLATATPQDRPLSAAIRRRNLRWGRKGEESHMETGGNRSKGTKASAVHWERQGTCCCLSLQVMAGSCSQYLIRWGKWAIPAPWSYAQIAFCTTFLTVLTYGQGTAWAQLCSRGHRENRTSLGAAQKLFSA